MNKGKNNGITLIALVITIIVLLILAGITVNLVMGENGIIKKAAKAKEDISVAQNEETVELAKSTNQIDKIIGSSRENELENSELKLVTSILNSSTNKGTYQMNQFQRMETESTANYMEYTTENIYEIKKSGWYMIDMNSFVAQVSNYCTMDLNVYINSNKIQLHTQGRNNSSDSNSKTLTLYLTNGNTINVDKIIKDANNDNYNVTSINIYAMEK